MNSLEKKCLFTGQNPIRKLLSKLKNYSSNPQCYIYPDLEVDSYYIVIPLRLNTGSSLWQMQDGKPRLLGYASKSLPDACKNCSITELEMTGLVINIHLWKHLLLRVEFDCAVDHRALPHHRILYDNYFMVATRNSTNAAGIKLPPVHGAQKSVDPNLKPESQAKSKKVLLKPTIQTPIKSPAQTPVTVKTPVSRLRTPGIVNSPPTVPGSLLNTPVRTNAPVVI